MMLASFLPFRMLLIFELLKRLKRVDRVWPRNENDTVTNAKQMQKDRHKK